MFSQRRLRPTSKGLLPPEPIRTLCRERNLENGPATSRRRCRGKRLVRLQEICPVLLGTLHCLERWQQS
ncbi:hypothetical protein L596_007122 [Steinernema carpocapsae]|uniref:Uncharacterized protein n=1 Tax=Steinernema carpocapsae TaxID=34508 RepID=A0A4U5P8C6_STECR|nr:hypothetical protein L596_007122 [Steinernema carpocapsae]